MHLDDKQAMDEFLFQRMPVEEREADETAVELLKNSPYNEDLASAGLFLKALAEYSDDLPALIRPHFGSQMAKKQRVARMTSIVEAAPELDRGSVAQTAALPLGGRVKLDPWSAEIELMTNNRVELLSAREKMAFQITPLMPYLARYDPADGVATASRPSDDGPEVASGR